MNKFFSFLFLVSLSVNSAFAQDGDLVLAGEKWIASFKNYVCVAFGPSVEAPSAFKDMNVVFEKITTDSTLDNGLIKATFEVNGKTCRYNAFVLADNDASTLKLVESKAYAPNKDADCSAGKEVLDAAFKADDYLYYGHPHNLAIMAPVAGASDICPGSSLVGINFVVSGRVK